VGVSEEMRILRMDLQSLSHRRSRLARAAKLGGVGAVARDFSGSDRSGDLPTRSQLRAG